MKLCIGENLKKLRRKKKVTQETLADYLSVSSQAVSRWENDATYPDIELLPEISAYFGVSMEELLGCRKNETPAEQKASELQEQIFSASITDPPKRAELLRELFELEQQYPNNWHIKSCIAESLVFPKPDSYDEVLPVLRRYADAASEAFPSDPMQNALFFIRYMVLAAPEEEVEQWASLLPIYDMNLRWNVLRIRYQEREEWEKARHYESLQMLLNLREHVNVGPISDNPKDALHAARQAERIYDAAIGIPYLDADGKVHNSICLYERIEVLLTKVLLLLGNGNPEANAEEEGDGFAVLQKAVDYAILYADAVKEEYFTADYPYFMPQKVGDHPCMNLAEQSALSDRCLDRIIALLDSKTFDAIRDNEQFRNRRTRLANKRDEIKEYWRLRSRNAE